jgi:hypothetical protein
VAAAEGFLPLGSDGGAGIEAFFHNGGFLSCGIRPDGGARFFGRQYTTIPLEKQEAERKTSRKGN